MRDNIQMIATIKVGRSYTWDIEVIGEPITTKTWSREDTDITQNEKITVENQDYSTKFSITKASRKVRLSSKKRRKKHLFSMSFNISRTRHCTKSTSRTRMVATKSFWNLSYWDHLQDPWVHYIALTSLPTRANFNGCHQRMMVVNQFSSMRSRNSIQEPRNGSR